jgi:hypothetical protein
MIPPLTNENEAARSKSAPGVGPWDRAQRTPRVRLDGVCRWRQADSWHNMSHRWWVEFVW